MGGGESWTTSSVAGINSFGWDQEREGHVVFERFFESMDAGPH